MAANPIFGAASDGGYASGGRLVFSCRRLGALALPWLPKQYVFLVSVVGFFLLASYPITEAAMSEVLPDQIRGRAFASF